ncbi:hypothetical protein ACX40Y_18120 [Sphingomonas sp. RS6]
MRWSVLEGQGNGAVQEEDGFTRWIEACAAGELLGIAMAALWWVTVERFDPIPMGVGAEIAVLLGKTGSGVIQGVVLGYLQSWAMKRQFPALETRGWVFVTVVAATAMWSVAAWYSVFPPMNGEPLMPPVQTLFQTAMTAAGFGFGVGALFGAVQAIVLRRAARNAHWWIATNAVGWGAALPCIYVASSVGSADPGSLEVAFRGLVGGVASGVVLGTITGLSFAVMQAKRPAGDAS